MQTFINPSKDKWSEIIQRPQIDNAELESIVSEILVDVKQNGDNAIKKYSLQFDGVKLSELRVTDQEIEAALEIVDNDLKNAIQKAKDNIEKFHLSQKEEIKLIETTSGVKCWRKSVAIDKVGLYIPGGTAPLFSTLLMLGIPALLAGCKEIIVCTPADKYGKINPAILYVAHLLGLKNVYKIGGVQAIAAMAYGTETISAVNKIFGPGNQYVTTAKQIISSQGIAIDMPAGPSEVAVYADTTCIPSFVAADLLSQAEHGNDSQVLLVATDQQIVDAVKMEIDLQSQSLSRKKIIENSLINARFIIMENIEQAFDLLNEYAPEHLIIASDNAELLAENVVNAGSVFLGHYSPESAGDYASGTNHTLPTNGNAKSHSGVSLDSFVKKITFQKISKSGIANIGSAIETMSLAEGLDAHKNAVSLRLKNL
ncbi:MAG: histidinol dehydrogenase [Chitinophagaceae bacterium]